MKHALLALALSMLAATAIGGCQERPPPSFGVRNAHGMTYDGARHQVTLFGGADERSVRGDTWAWNGRKWRLLATKGPPARTFPVMAYDAARKRVLLFGGNRVLFGNDRTKDTLLGDLWSWDGRLWTQLADGSAGPTPRAEACGGYDETRHRFVVFGGYTKSGATVRRLGDTWEWDGTTWTRVDVEGPIARSGAAMTYVPAQGNLGPGMLLFGGATGTPPPRDDTWLWDGKSWTLLGVRATAGRFNANIVYDAERRTLFRFGGWTGSTRVADLWRIEGDAWRDVDAAGPSARNHSGLVYDPERRYAVLAGGHDGDRVFGDTWLWDGTAWREAESHLPTARVDNGH